MCARTYSQGCGSPRDPAPNTEQASELFDQLLRTNKPYLSPPMSSFPFLFISFLFPSSFLLSYLLRKTSLNFCSTFHSGVMQCPLEFFRVSSSDGFIGRNRVTSSGLNIEKCSMLV